jgi:hypothetical protein
MNDITIGDRVQVTRTGYTGTVIDIDSDGDIYVDLDIEAGAEDWFDHQDLTRLP